MARKPRVEYAGAVYHVISRGNRREKIVEDDPDRERFLETMAEGCERMGWRLHAWALMTNHYHWLLETPEPNLVRGMQWFQTTWSTRFRVRHGLSGHVLQGRYKAHLIDPRSDTHFQAVSSYIHLNPVRAKGMLQPEAPLEAYRWSSYPHYLQSPGRRPDWMVTERVLGNLGLTDSPAGRRAYRRHMDERVAEVRGERGRNARTCLVEEWKALGSEWCHGDAAFRDQMLTRVAERVGATRRASLDGAPVREHEEGRAEALIRGAMAKLGLTEKELTRLRKTDPRKQAMAWLVRKHTSVRNRWVTERLGMGHEVNVSQSVRRVEEATKGELRRLRGKVRAVREAGDRH